MGRLDGKAALVTGAGSGIGRETARLLAEEGAHVLVADINREGAEETKRLIADAGTRVEALGTDVTKPDAVEQMVAQAVTSFGRLDCAVNNAGIGGTFAPVMEYPQESWHAVIAVNLTAVFLAVQYETRQMVGQGGGSIVNMASILGLVAFAQAPAYTAAKHGVVGLTRAAALDVSTQGVRVNAVCPGFIETPMVTQGPAQATPGSEAHREIAALHPMQRMGQPREIAPAIVWLCSDESSFVTGQTLVADGGYVAQ